MVSKEDVLKYKIIRQPYRITMAKWNFTVPQKRIMTKMISLLQKEISLVSNGISVGQLEIFSEMSDSIKLTFSLNEVVKNSNNYSEIRTALSQLRRFDVQIILPAIRGKTSRHPEEETILTGLIERVVLTKHSRTVTIIIHKATALELIKTTNGLTQFAEEIMYLTNNAYTQKLYEMISHWKDKEVFSISPEDFRERLFLTNKYPATKDLIRRVIKPAEIELKEIGDVFFIFKTTITGRKLTKFNFIIKHRRTIYEEDLNKIKLRNDNIQLLKVHLGFREEHIQAVSEILSRNEIIGDLRKKIMDIFNYIQETNINPYKAITSIPEYVIKSLKNEFG